MRKCFWRAAAGTAVASFVSIFAAAGGFKMSGTVEGVNGPKIASEAPALPRSAIIGSGSALKQDAALGLSVEAAAPSAGAPAEEPRPVLVSDNGGGKFLRLPDYIRPEAYDIKIKVDPDAGNFSGEETIDLDLKQGTDKIILNAVDLSVSEASLDGRALTISINPETQTMSLTLPDSAGPGKARLRLSFSGPLNRQMRGLYLSTAKHKESDGSEKMENYAFTQFEAVDARRMFPSFDEPSFKSKFKLTVTAPSDLKAISNMPQESSSKDGAWTTTKFAETPKMSTYLLALAVARLVPSQTVMVGKTKITVWTRPEDAGQAEFALKAAQKTLGYLNKYFDRPYSLPKLDLVAVPDFSAGAMENWGAIFFRDSAVLIDPRMSSTKAQRRVDEVVSHEIVHQWFGDLVTMKWWNDLWLNESFATWLAYKTVDHKRPGWLTWQAFERERRSALAIDALKNTRPVSSEVKDPAEINEMFDVLTYEKGGSVLRMLENFLTESRFRSGVRSYMKKYAYSNTEAKDLWNELKAASNKPVDSMAKDWLTQEGYPIVSVDSLTPDNRTLRLKQGRFMIGGTQSDASETWTIPVVIRYKDFSGVKILRVILKDKEMEVKIPGRGPVAWVYPNADETGYYRVSLGENLRTALAENARAALTPIERSGFLADLWAQSKAGEKPLSVFLDSLYRLKDDPSRMVLEDVSGYLKTMAYTLVSDRDRGAFSKFTQDMLASHFKRLGLPKKGEGDEARLARAAVWSALGELAPTAPLMKNIKKSLALYMKDPQKVDPTLAWPILAVGALNGDSDLFSKYQERFQNAATPEVRDNFLAALAEFKSPELTQKALEMARAKDAAGQDIVRAQDAWKPFGRLLGHPWSQGAAWDFVRNNWTVLRRKVGQKGAERIIQSLTGMDTPEWLAQIKDFFARPENQVPSARRSLAQTLEIIEAGIRFKAVQSQGLASWLESKYGPEKRGK